MSADSGAREWRERLENLAAAAPDGGAAVEKKRDVRTERRRPVAQHPGFRGKPEEPAAPEKNGGGVAAAAAEAALRRDPLLQIDPHAAAHPGLLEKQPGRTMGEVVLPETGKRRAVHPDPAARGPQGDPVAERNRLEDGAQFVVTVARAGREPQDRG